MILTLVGGIAINTLIPKCDDGIFEFTSVQLLSRVQLFATPCSMSGFPVHHQLLKLAQTHVY